MPLKHAAYTLPTKSSTPSLKRVCVGPSKHGCILTPLEFCSYIQFDPAYFSITLVAALLSAPILQQIFCHTGYSPQAAVLQVSPSAPTAATSSSRAAVQDRCSCIAEEAGDRHSSIASRAGCSKSTHAWWCLRFRCRCNAPGAPRVVVARGVCRPLSRIVCISVGYERFVWYAGVWRSGAKVGEVAMRCRGGAADPDLA
jgi:hypothetical protein